MRRGEAVRSHDAWLLTFDSTLRRYFGVSHTDIGADDALLDRYRDLTGEDAAFEFALDYDLDRLDWWAVGRELP